MAQGNNGEFYADGRHVYKSPTENKKADGSTGVSLGFRVCTCEEHVDGAAEEIAKALNSHDALVAALNGIMPHALHWVNENHPDVIAVRAAISAAEGH